MKKFAYFIIGCALVGLLIGFIFTQIPLSKALGEGLVQNLKYKNYAQIYQLFTQDFRKNYSYEQFEGFLRQSHLDHYQSVEWGPAETDKKKGYGFITGKITTTDNQKFFIEIDYLREGKDKWSINSIRKINSPSEAGIDTPQ